jgi:Methyltransferase FkbM domain
MKNGEREFRMRGIKTKQMLKRLLYGIPLGRFPQIKLPWPQLSNSEPAGDIVSPQRAFRLLLNRIPVVMNHPSPSSVQQILTALRPLDVTDRSFVRKGRNADGGYVMLDSEIENAIAYSLGVNDEISWDVDMVSSGCQVFQYDHTVKAAPFMHPSMHFFKIGIAAESSLDGVFKSIEDLIEENGHQRRHDLILKMDIEGSEWDVIREMKQSALEQFSQIVIEWHFPDFSNIADLEQLESVLSILRKLNHTHQVIHIHANNEGRMGLIGGVSIPEGIEVTYVRRDNYRFEECKKLFPTLLDRPNDPCLPDYLLGALGQL